MQLSSINALNQTRALNFGTTFKVDLGEDPKARKEKLNGFRLRLGKQDTQGLIIVPVVPPTTKGEITREYLIITHPSEERAKLPGQSTEDHTTARFLMSQAFRTDATPQAKVQWQRLVGNLVQSAQVYPPSKTQPSSVDGDKVVGKNDGPKSITVEPATKRKPSKTQPIATKKVKKVAISEGASEGSKGDGKRVRSRRLNDKGFQVINPNSGTEG